VTMSGGYAPDIEAIVSIHCNTIREAASSAAAWAKARPAVPEPNGRSPAR
jgi:hypothetical protein